MEEFKPFTTERPWGNFRQYTLNQPTTVKTVLVKKGEVLSLQYHNDRQEFWRVLAGEPEVTIGDGVFKANVGDEFEIPAQTKHRISAPEQDVEILEISSGNFDESDIIRLEDKYGRN
ncbi:MAG: phosphomannose isomerase type II C-terminal cupin domain [Candidatus Paceibacterota bacterium]